ncbi:MAG TPA: CatA-like O-acetyltransferase [Longimicrobium sp.]
MGHYIDLDRWARREHFHLFRGYDRPHFSVSTDVDVTALYEASRRPEGPSFILATLFAGMHAASATEAFRLRIRGERVWCHDTVSIGCTVLRPDRTFGFGYFPYDPSFSRFAADGRAELERARAGTSLLEDAREEDDAYLHSTVLPWIRFTSFTNALRREDSVPKLVFGQRFAVGDAWRMPVAVEVHHALVDGIDVGEFLKRLQDLLAKPPGE